MLIPKLRPRANYGKGVVVEDLEFSWAAGGDKPDTRCCSICCKDGQCVPLESPTNECPTNESSVVNWVRDHSFSGFNDTS